MQKIRGARYSENMKLRFDLSNYFMRIHIQDAEVHRESNPSADERYMNDKFQPTFLVACRLINNAPPHKLNLRPLAKLMDQFSEMLISAGTYSQEELSTFWATPANLKEIEIQSARLKEMGAGTLSAIVAHSPGPQRGPHRPGSRQSTNKRPTVR